MFKEKNYLIKSVNYYAGINNENENKFSGSIEPHKIKNINNDNIFINKNCTKPNINRAKQYKELKYFNQRKKNVSSLSGEIQLSFDKNDTVINNNNLCINNDIIYKRMLETNNNKRKEVQTIKIIKCEKINMTNKNKILQTNKKTRNYPSLLTQINSKKNLLLKTDSTNSNDNNNSFNKEIVNTIKIKRNNNKDQNKICMNHSLTFISEKKGSLTERKIDKTHKKFLLRNRLKNPVINNKIEDKGYLDSIDFMNVVNEDNNLKKNKKVIFDNKTQKKNKVNITIPEKKIIEILKKINAGNLKKKEKEKRNIEEANNNKILMVNNGISKNIKTEENKKININNRCNNDIENLNKEIEELKNNLNNKNFKDTRKELINKFQDKKKEENKSLKVSQSKKDNYKTLKYKIIDGHNDKEIISNINNIDDKKEIKKENMKIKYNNGNIIMNKENFNRINQRNQDGIINKEVRKNNKNIKNLVLKTKKLGINLTKKIKKYYSLKNKTLEEVNNNSYKNLLNKEIKKDILKLESNINNKKNINRQLEINEINNNSRKNSDLMNEIYFYKTEINNNNIKSCEIEKSNVLINNQNDTKQNLNLTTRDETFKTYNNSKDIENNEFNNFAKESVNDNNQVKSCESQVISGINGPNTTYFSGFNKSELKMLNKINLDMPINLDLCNEDNKDLKEDNLKENLDEIKINIEENKDNKKMNNTLTLKDKKFKKLENFINKFNENEGEIEEGKIIHFHNETPLYGLSIADVNFILNDVNSNINKDINNKNKIKKTESEINKIKSNFYDDINYEKEDYKNKKNIKSYSCNNLDFLDINDLSNNDQDFIDNIELIQKNNFILISNNEIKEDKNKNETIKEIDTEYEFNLNEDKFCVPLQKYEEKSFNKINPF